MPKPAFAVLAVSPPAPPWLRHPAMTAMLVIMLLAALALLLIWTA
jgi:hypothetical protein